MRTIYLALSRSNKRALVNALVANAVFNVRMLTLSGKESHRIQPGSQVRASSNTQTIEKNSCVSTASYNHPEGSVCIQLCFAIFTRTGG